MAPLLMSAVRRLATQSTHRQSHSLCSAAAALSSQTTAFLSTVASPTSGDSTVDDPSCRAQNFGDLHTSQRSAWTAHRSFLLIPSVGRILQNSEGTEQKTACPSEDSAGDRVPVSSTEARDARSRPGPAEAGSTHRRTQHWMQASPLVIGRPDLSLPHPSRCSQSSNPSRSPYASHSHQLLSYSSHSSRSSRSSRSSPPDASLARISLPWLSTLSSASPPRPLLPPSQRLPVSRSFSTAAAAEASQEGLELTDSCVERMRQLQKEEGKPVFLRLAVEGGGCSGFQYVFTLEDSPREDDKVFRKGDAVLLVDDVTLSFVKGSKVNFAEELIRSSFEVIENPNSSSSCGCGASFVAK